MSSETHLMSWDVRAVRKWHPYYLLGDMKRIPEPVPPVTVSIGAEFDDNNSAADFERRVREILEEMS